MRAYDVLLKAAAYLSGIIIAGMALLVTADVLIRYFNYGSIRWSTELIEFSLFFVTALGAPLVLRLNGHVRVDIIAAALPPRARRVLGTIECLIEIAICAVIVYVGALAAFKSFSNGIQVYGTISFPEWWLIVMAPLMALLFLIEFIRRLLTGVESTLESAGGL